MASINDYIDEAVVLAKQRASKFDETKEFTDEDTLARLCDRAFIHLDNACNETDSLLEGFEYDEEFLRDSLLDAINNCSLALARLR